MAEDGAGGMRTREDGADTVRWWGARAGLGGPLWVLGMGTFPQQRGGEGVPGSGLSSG